MFRRFGAKRLEVAQLFRKELRRQNVVIGEYGCVTNALAQSHRRLRGGYRFGNLEAVRIISKSAIAEFCETHKDALESLLHWHSMTRRADWRHLANVRADFPHADAVGIFTVFNIGGNKYWLISVIKYRWQIVYIRHILTHAEYGKGRWKL